MKKPRPVSDTTQKTEKSLQNLKKWQPGQTGNPAGRPKSSRNRLTEEFLAAMADDFSAHGKAAIVNVREQDPAKYLTIVAHLVPKETDVNLKGDEAFVKVWTAVASGTLAALVDQIDGEEARH